MIQKTIISFFTVITFFSCNRPQKTTVTVSNTIQKEIEYPFITEFNKYIESSVSDSSYPGAAIVVVKDSSVIYIEGLGLREIGTTDSVNLHTVFRLASVSKGFAAVLAGIFVQKGLIKWDDKIIKYLPDFKLNTKKSTELLTIKNVLDQTTGLPTHTYTNLIEDGVPYNVLRDKLKDVHLTAEPGKLHSYQNVAYSLIADVLEKVSGKSYETLLKEEIFAPLKMEDASASFEAIENSPNHALPHLIKHKKFVIVKNAVDYYSVLPAAGVNASITDMSKYLLALLGNNPDILHPSMLKELFVPEVITPKRRKYFFMRWLPVKKTSYGMGWRILEYNNDTVAYHGGYVKGYRAEIALIPKHKLGIAILSNAPGKFINSAIPTLFDLFYKYSDSENEKSGE